MGITTMVEFKEDIKHGFQALKESETYVGFEQNIKFQNLRYVTLCYMIRVWYEYSSIQWYRTSNIGSGLVELTFGVELEL